MKCRDVRLLNLAIMDVNQNRLNGSNSVKNYYAA